MGSKKVVLKNEPLHIRAYIANLLQRLRGPYITHLALAQIDCVCYNLFKCVYQGGCDDARLIVSLVCHDHLGGYEMESPSTTSASNALVRKQYRRAVRRFDWLQRYVCDKFHNNAPEMERMISYLMSARLSALANAMRLEFDVRKPRQPVDYNIHRPAPVIERSLF
jgi:hypothetical protein